jgi:hypothetical protein
VLAKRYVMVVATAFFILALICVYSTMRLIDAAGSVSAQEKVNAQYFSHLWKNANPDEQKIIKSVILRSPMDPVVLGTDALRQTKGPSIDGPNRVCAI